MSITSFIFFLFVFVSIFIYYITPKRYSYIVLLASSLFFLFYNSLTIKNIIVITSIFIISYVSGFLINKFRNSTLTRFTCIFGVVLILSILFIVKYFSISTLGISYFALIMMGYIIDVYWEVYKEEKNPLRLLLFMTYYPILTSGPFIKYNEQNKELFEKKKFNLNNLLTGFLRMLIGIFKVIVISTRLGLIVDNIYGNISTMSGVLVICAILIYTLELYTNFSGTIDIVIGISNMYGIRLPENFDNPFLSTSITEFWRRWHITLGTWLKNYIFYPVCKSDIIQNLTTSLKKHMKSKKAKKVVLYICLLILWFVIGLWHGGRLNFIVASGLLQYLFIVVEDIFEPMMKKRVDKDKKIIRIISMIRVYILFSLSMVFFRATNLSNGAYIISSIFNSGSMNILDIIDLFDIILVIIGIVSMFIFEYKRENNLIKFRNISIDKKAIIICTLILLIIVFGHYGIGFDKTDFIYGRF